MIVYETDIGVTDPRIIQFENVNEGRSYPFDDDADLTAIDGKKLPDWVISDMHLVMSAGLEAFLSSVYISDSMISVCIKLFNQSSLSSALSVVVRKESFNSYQPQRLEKLTGYEDIGGIITFGNVRFDVDKGSYRFSDRSVRVAECAISRYKPASLRSLIDDRTGERLAGDIKVDFPSYVDVKRVDDKLELVLKQGASDALMTACDKKKPVNACGATPIKSINGVYPDDKKRLVIWFH